MKMWPQKIINFLTGFLLLSSLHCTMTAVIADAELQTFFYSFVYLPIVIILSVSEKKTKHFWQYLLCSSVALGAAYFISRTEVERGVALVLTVLAIFSFFYSNARKIDCWLDKPSYMFLGIFLGMYLLELRFESILLENYAIYGAGIYYLLCIFQTNISEMEYLVSMSGELKRFPMRRMFQSNWLMMGIQTIVVVVGMCAASFLRVDGLLSKMAGVLRDIIAWLLSFLETEEVATGVQEAEQEMELGLTQTTEISWFMEFLLKVWDVISWIIVIAITGYAIYRILKYLYQLYRDFDVRSAENGDQIEQIRMSMSKEEKKKLKKQRQESLFWDRSPNARIRKNYKKRVLKELKDTPKPSMTPEEIEQGVVMGEEEKNIFHTYYEKARYGKDGCTKEDVLRYKF